MGFKEFMTKKATEEEKYKLRIIPILLVMIASGIMAFSNTTWVFVVGILGTIPSVIWLLTWIRVVTAKNKELDK